MTELERAHGAAQALQFALARALMEKKRPTLDEIFSLLSAAMVAQEYLRREVERLDGTSKVRGK